MRRVAWLLRSQGPALGYLFCVLLGVALAQLSQRLELLRREARRLIRLAQPLGEGRGGGGNLGLLRLCRLRLLRVG